MIKNFGMKILLIVTLAFFSIASPASAVDNYVEVTNNYTVPVWALFKCYTNTSWEMNSCRYENTYIFIKPGDKHTWRYKYTKGMGCQKIYIKYGRADRSCEGCDKKLEVAFQENEAKRFRISASGSGDLEFIITPIYGTFVN